MRKAKPSAKQYLWKALDKMTEEYKDIYRESHHREFQAKQKEIKVPQPISERLNVILTLLRIEIQLEQYRNWRNRV